MFNDVGVVIDTLREQFGIQRIAYVDIDVHHGDGLYYPYEEDPDLIYADIHQDGRTLYPGTGHAHETGKGAAKGTKLNIPLLPGMGDKEFFEVWEAVEAHLRKFKPEFILFQCGADSLAGDPLAMLQYTPARARARGEAPVRAGERAGRRAHHGLRRRRLQPRQSRRGVVRGAGRVSRLEALLTRFFAVTK